MVYLNTGIFIVQVYLTTGLLIVQVYLTTGKLYSLGLPHLETIYCLGLPKYRTIYCLVLPYYWTINCVGLSYYWTICGRQLDLVHRSSRGSSRYKPYLHSHVYWKSLYSYSYMMNSFLSDIRLEICISILYIFTYVCMPTIIKLNTGQKLLDEQFYQ